MSPSESFLWRCFMGMKDGDVPETDEQLYKIIDNSEILKGKKPKVKLMDYCYQVRQMEKPRLTAKRMVMQTAKH
jgi:hypothetical protein